MSNGHPAESIDAALFADLLAGMSRMLTTSATIPLFTNHIGLSEWAALSILSRSEGISNSKLAKKLGVTARRSTQIISGLSKAGLVSIALVNKDSKKNELRVTSEGKKQLENIDEQITIFLTPAVSRPRLINNGLKITRLITKVLITASKNHNSD